MRVTFKSRLVIFDTVCDYIFNSFEASSVLAEHGCLDTRIYWITKILHEFIS